MTSEPEPLIGEIKAMWILGEIKPMWIEGKIRNMIWNGKKWLNHDDVYPLIHYALTGEPVNYGDKDGNH